jgi:LSD1 subclass zinc finger protein
MLIDNVVRADAPLGKTGSVSTLSDDMNLDSGREDPKCTCGAALPDEIVQFAERGFAMCGACGKRTSVRPPPAELAPLVRGATFVIGENLAQLAGAVAQDAPKSREPVVLNCTNCRAPLQLDGANRRVRCQYCNTDLYLPDEVWLKLHPIAAVQRFYLVWPSAAAVIAAKQATFAWGTLYAAEVGADGNLYCFGVGGGSWSVWCMAPDFRVRWLNQKVESVAHISDATMALDPTGRVLVWNGKQHSLQVFSATDGASLGRLGGKQPADATTRVLDVVKLDELAVDRDGTLVALIGGHLCRFAPDGNPIELWPAKSGLFGTKHEKLLPLYDPDGGVKDTETVYPESVASHPHVLDGYTRIAVGWDGMYYFVRDEWVAKLDRTGKVMYRVNVVDNVAGKIGADAAGNAYVVARNDRQRSLLRISPDGKHIDRLQTDHLNGGSLCHDDDTLSVGSDGTTYHLRFDMVLRVIAPDGRAVFVSDKAKELDAKERAARDKADQ